VGAAVAWWVALGVGLAVADAAAVGRRVGVLVTVARAVGVALAVGVARPVDDALTVDDALAVAVGRAVAELRPVLPDDGEGVRDAPPEAVLVVTPGVGVKTDGTVEEGDPPPLQAATATASTAAPAAARPARSRACRGCGGRIGAGQLASGTVRRTFMKPPRMTGGQWRGSTHLSMCHPNRR
jgi:hypothetical protein